MEGGGQLYFWTKRKSLDSNRAQHRVPASKSAFSQRHLSTLIVPSFWFNISDAHSQDWSSVSLYYKFSGQCIKDTEAKKASTPHWMCLKAPILRKDKQDQGHLGNLAKLP